MHPAAAVLFFLGVGVAVLAPLIALGCAISDNRREKFLEELERIRNGERY